MYGGIEMSRNITINIDTCGVRIDPSSGGCANLSFDMFESDLDALIGQLEAVEVLGCIDEDTILQYVGDKGYNVTEE